MAEENSTGSNFIWAIALIIVVAIIAFVVFKSGLLSGGGTKKEQIDIKIDAPPSR